MDGIKFEQRFKACVGVVKNLRSEDLFAFNTLDDSAQVAAPLQKVSDKHQLIKWGLRKFRSEAARISEEVGAWLETNYCAESGIPKRMLLLSDGLANRGVVGSCGTDFVGGGLEQKKLNLMFDSEIITTRISYWNGKRWGTSMT